MDPGIDSLNWFLILISHNKLDTHVIPPPVFICQPLINFIHYIQ